MPSSPDPCIAIHLKRGDQVRALSITCNDQTRCWIYADSDRPRRVDHLYDRDLALANASSSISRSEGSWWMAGRAWQSDYLMVTRMIREMREQRATFAEPHVTATSRHDYHCTAWQRRAQRRGGRRVNHTRIGPSFQG
jgi:hypothetical protein